MELLKIKVKKNNIYYFLIMLFCIMDMKCFYLINTGMISILGISYGDCLFLLEILFGGFVLVKYRFLRNEGLKNKYIGYMIFALFLSISSAIVATKTYSQPFMLGISSQHLWIGTILVFGAIYLLLQLEKITIDGLLNRMLYILLFYCSICIIQYLLSGKVLFTYSDINERYGNTRYYFTTVYLSLFSGFAIDYLFNFTTKLNSKLLKVLIVLFSTIFINAIVTKGRMATMALIISIAISVILRRKLTWKKIFAVIVGILCVCVFLQTDMGSDLLAVFKGGQSLAGDTTTVRSFGRKYYLNLLLNDPVSILFGCGTPNVNWSIAQMTVNPLSNLGGTARYYLSDNGILSPLYIYGITGFIWWVLIICSCIIQGYKIYKFSGETAYIQFPLFEVLGCMTLVPSLFGTRIVFVLYLAMLAKKVNVIKEIKNNDKATK